MKYELTLTLKPMMYQFKAKEQFDLTKDKLYDVLSQYIPCTAIAELTKEHNVHYHCMLELDTIEAKDKLFNKFRNHKAFGKKSLTQVQFEDSYKKYMVKDLENTRKIIKDPIVYDSYGCAKTIF